MTSRRRLLLPLFTLVLALAACSSHLAPTDRISLNKQVGNMDASHAGLADGDSAKSVGAGAAAAPELESDERQSFKNGAPKTPAKDATTENDRDENAPADADKKEAQPSEPGAGKKSPQTPATAGLYIIRSAQLSEQVPSVKDAQKRIGVLVAAHHGFVTDAKLDTAEGGVPSATLTVRVPANQFDPLLDSLGDVGTVRSRQVSGEDVTLDYIDTGSRVRNLQREESQLLQLLQRAGKLPDVLQVERELARVRGEIEQAQGRLRHLAGQVDLSTIEISLTEKIVTQEGSPWQLDASFQNAWRSAQRQLAGDLQSLTSSAIEFVVATLPIVVLALCLFALLGWIARLILVDAFKLLGTRNFRLLWAAVGIVAIASLYPAMLGVIAVVGVVLAILAGGSALVTRFFGRREID